MLPVAVVRSSSDGNAMRYVLPVLWMTSYFHIMCQKQRRRICFVEFARWRQWGKLLSMTAGFLQVGLSQRGGVITAGARFRTNSGKLRINLGKKLR